MNMKECISKTEEYKYVISTRNYAVSTEFDFENFDLNVTEEEPAEYSEEECCSEDIDV